VENISNFIHLDIITVLYLFIVGFVGGLISGFIGSSGAFLLTPAMMSLGVPGVVAVASNICHKFPKALIGAIKCARYGQVDVKLGIVLGVSAEAGMLYGAYVQEEIKKVFGDAGCNLYVSLALIIVLAVVIGYVLYDAWNISKVGTLDLEEKVSKFARRVQAIHIPGTMVYFSSLKSEISVLFTIPIGFATGMLAATIAVGGFIGVPAMHYIMGVPSLIASATELVIAFVMGLGGTIQYSWSSLVDIRLAMIILAGSLFGIQLGAIGTTYVKPYLIKVVMGVIMILVLISRSIVIPVYLSDLGITARMDPSFAKLLNNVSFSVMITALVTGAFIVLYALIKGMRADRVEKDNAAAILAFTGSNSVTGTTQLDPIGRLERILVVTDGSDHSAGAVQEAIRLAQRCGGQLRVLSVIAAATEYETLGVQLLKREQDNTLAHLQEVQLAAVAVGVECEVRMRQGTEVYQEIVAEAEEGHMDVIVMGRRGRTGLLRTMMGSTTARVIGHTNCSVFVVPRAARMEGRSTLLAVDGSRYSDAAAAATANISRPSNTPVTVVSVSPEDASPMRQREVEDIVARITRLLNGIGITACSRVMRGRPDLAIVEAARAEGSDLIVMGSHGRTGLDRVLLGSVSERVIGHANCAVLVVKA